jgi:hypothetical protein
MYSKGFSPQNFKAGEFTVLAQSNNFKFPVFYRGEVRFSGQKVLVCSEYFSISFRSFERFIAAYLAAKDYRKNYPTIWKLELEYHQDFLNKRGRAIRDYKEYRMLRSGFNILSILKDDVTPLIGEVLSRHAI